MRVFLNVPAQDRNNLNPRIFEGDAEDVIYHRLDEMGNSHCLSADKHVATSSSDSVGKNVEESKVSDEKSGRPSFKVRVRIPVIVTKVASNIGTFLDKVIFVDDNSLPTTTVSRPRRVHGGVLLYGCDTPEEHFDRHAIIMSTIEELQLTGEKGLQAAGLEFVKYTKNSRKEEEENNYDPSRNEMKSNENEHQITNSDNYNDECFTRLMHRQSKVFIDNNNRRKFISDGKMYDEIARLCTEYAQEWMIKKYKLKWITLSDDDDEDIPIRALVSSTHPAASGTSPSSSDKPTLLIITGKGGVRAGIFSRQHMMTTGVEPSTALYAIGEAHKRDMNVILLDPNVRGEKLAYLVIEQSMSILFDYIEKDTLVDDTTDNDKKYPPLLIQSHSAAGANIVRYLMDKSKYYIPNYLKAIVFTDSTHSIQWTKENHPELCNFLQSSAAVYFRSSKSSFCVAKCPAAGEDVETDSTWHHRFGNIRTCWAGTREHSLSDWSARERIWEHFDQKIIDNINDDDNPVADDDEDDDPIAEEEDEDTPIVVL